MAKKKYTTEYFNLKPQLKYNTTYHIVYGERNDGKTYGAKVDALIDDIRNGFNFVYMRRLHQHIVRKNMVKLFGDVQHIIEKEFGSQIYYDSQKGFYLNIGGEEKVVGFVVNVQDGLLSKGIPIVNIRTILFDEFIDYSYMPEEIPKFLHLVSSICRPPNRDVRIIMLGNTISRNCPYFKLFGIDTRKIKQGEIYYIKHNLGVTATVQHTPTKVEDLISKKKTDKYIGFDDNESVNMIMFGEWEYQHCQTKQIDGIGWNCMRHFIPIYFTALNNIYEFTINTDIKMPILFIRKINIQYGKCKTKVKYNLSSDNSVVLINNNGIVPSISKINELVDEGTLKKWHLALLCLECDRVIFDTIETGSEFRGHFKEVVNGKI